MVKSEVTFRDLQKARAAETSETTARDFGIPPEDASFGGLKYCVAGGRVNYAICQALIILGMRGPCIDATAVAVKMELPSLSSNPEESPPGVDCPRLLEHPHTWFLIWSV